MSDVWTAEVDWESIESRFRPPLELLPPTPRRVTSRDGAGSAGSARLERGCLAGCLTPIFLLGLMLLFWAGLAALILPLGATTTGVITQRERGKARDSTQSLRFRFQVDTRPYAGQGQVPTETWKRMKVGDTIRVRYFPFAPGLRPLLADNFSPWASIFGLGILGLLMVGIAALPLAGIITPRPDDKLVRNGVVVPAFIIKHDISTGQVTFLIRARNKRVFEIVEPSRSANYRPGQIETAIYFPNKPQNARLYSNLNYKPQSTGTSPT